MLAISAAGVAAEAAMSSHTSSPHYVPSADVVGTIVLPTIGLCVAMVVAMLIGINKCKQWELDKIVEMRRTRRVIQRITARLREKNFRTIERARNMRKRAVTTVSNPRAAAVKSGDADANANANAPPAYVGASAAAPQESVSGNSPPPAYEDVLLDGLYYECMPKHRLRIKNTAK